MSFLGGRTSTKPTVVFLVTITGSDESLAAEDRGLNTVHCIYILRAWIFSRTLLLICMCGPNCVYNYTCMYIYIFICACSMYNVYQN